MATRAMNSNAAVAIGVVVLLLVALSRRDGRHRDASHLGSDRNGLFLLRTSLGRLARETKSNR
jgi:hypothetical protein